MLVEYGILTVKMIAGKPECVIGCTAPIGIIERLSKINEQNLKMIVQKDNKVFVEIPDKLFDGVD